VHVDSRLEQFTALIEQQRSRQPGIRSTEPIRPLTRETGFTSRLESTRTEQPASSDVAERARQAMALRNPALAAKLARARMSQASQGIARTSAITATARVNPIGEQIQVRQLTPVSNDLLAVPKRPAQSPGLGTSVDTYA